jgi:hypothetical protein
MKKREGVWLKTNFWGLILTTALIGTVWTSAKDASLEVATPSGLIASGQAPGSAARNDLATKNDITSLLRNNPEDLKQDALGNVVFLALRGTNASDQNLSTAGTLPSIRELVIQGRGRRGTPSWTTDGISQLRKLPRLEKLRILCVSLEPALETEVFQEICHLQGLRSLMLVAASPKQSDFAYLTNLQNLVELHINYATNFGDPELSLLTNLPNLKHVGFACDAISRDGTNVFDGMPGLTNTMVLFPKTQL